MAKTNQTFKLASVEPSFIAALTRVLGIANKVALQTKLADLEVEMSQVNEMRDPQEQQAYRTYLIEMLDSDSFGISAALLSYTKGGRAVQVGSVSKVPALDDLANNPAGLVEWVRANECDSFEIVMSSSASDGVSGVDVHLNLRGYGVGGSLTVVVEGWPTSASSQQLVDSLLDSLQEEIRPYIAPDESAEFAVFLGHGHGSDWKLLKKSLEDAGYPVRAFESVPRAGDVNIKVVEASIRGARAAVLHLTPDDELRGGVKRGRQNVIHEIGFAQGALGVRQVVIVQHVDVEMPTNLAGVSVIRYESNSIFDQLDALVENLNEIRIRNSGSPGGPQF